jgi:hypothetical protein
LNPFTSTATPWASFFQNFQFIGLNPFMLVRLGSAHRLFHPTWKAFSTVQQLATKKHTNEYRPGNASIPSNAIFPEKA